METVLEKEHLRHYNHDIIAKTGIQTLCSFSLEKDPFRKLISSRNKYVEMYPENTVFENTSAFFLTGLTKQNTKKETREKKHKIFQELKTKNTQTVNLATKKIKPGAKVFIHSFNNQTYDLILNSSKNKKIKTHMVENYPARYGTHIINQQKEKYDINVFNDLNIVEAVTGADICFIGFDSINKNSALVKTGTKLVLDQTAKKQIPTYIIGHTWKHDKKNNTKKTITKFPNTYESIDYKKVTGIILEHGIFKPNQIEHELTNANNFQ